MEEFAMWELTISTEEVARLISRSGGWWPQQMHPARVVSRQVDVEGGSPAGGGDC